MCTTSAEDIVAERTLADREQAITADVVLIAKSPWFWYFSSITTSNEFAKSV